MFASVVVSDYIQRPWSTGLEAPSNEMPVVPVLRADPVKVLRLFSFSICSCAVRLNSSKQCAYTRHLMHVGMVAIGIQYSVRLGHLPVHCHS